MASDDKEYEQSALGKRVNELMDDGYDFGEAVKQAMSEGLKDGGSVGIEILFGPKREDFNIGGRAKRNTPIDSRASVLDYANALQKVGAGTAAQKSKDLSNYIQSYTPKGAPAALATAAQFAQGILGVDLGTPQTRSMTNFLQKTIQDKIAQSGKLSGSIDYRDYGVQTDAKGQHPYGKGDASFTSPEFALATTLGKGDYSVDPKTGKVTFTGGTAYDFPEKSLPFGLGEFISKGGFFGDKALDYSPNVTLDSDFMKQFNQPKYPDYKTAALQSQFYKNNPSSLDPDLFRAAYARALPNSGIKTTIGSEGNIITNYGNYDPSNVYSAYMSNRGTSSSNPFFDQFKGSQYADMPAIMKAMYGDPGNLNPYYADGGRVGLFMGGDPLTGQALSIYESMNAYGFSDQEIANALRARGLYDVAPVETPVTNVAPNIINQDRGGDGRSDPPGPRGPGFFSGLNEDDYEADAYNIGPTFAGTFARGKMGVQSLISKLRSLPTPLNIALNVIENINNPYTNPFGNLNRGTREAINREEVRDLQDRMDKGQFGSTTPTPQDERRGGQYTGGGGGKGNKGGGGGNPYGGGPGGLHAKDGGLATMFKKKR